MNSRLIHLNPVELAIKRLGSMNALARFLGKDPATIARWRKKKLIASESMQKLHGILTLEELIYGGEIIEEN